MTESLAEVADGLGYYGDDYQTERTLVETIARLPEDVAAFALAHCRFLIAAADEPVMFQAEGRMVPAHLAFDHRVDVLRDLRKTGWIVLEVWPAEAGDRGHARRRFSAAQASITPSGREALELIG